MVHIMIAFTNFTLQTVALEYETCCIGSFDGVIIGELLQIVENKNIVVYMTFGIPAPSGKHGYL